MYLCLKVQSELYNIKDSELSEMVYDLSNHAEDINLNTRSSNYV